MIGLVWFLLAIPSLIVNVLGFVMGPLTALLSDKYGGYPRWLSWWMTPDSPIDGDAGHLARNPDGSTWWKRVVRRAKWLTRNRGYGFSYGLAGRGMVGKTHFWGDRRVSDNPMHAGWCWAYNNGAWEIYGFVPWWPKAKRGLRVRLGWKIPMTLDTPTGRQMLATHINPIKSYQE